MDKKSGSVSEMNNPDHISESLEINFFGLKYLIFWCRSEIRDGNKIRIRDGKNSDPGKTTLIRNTAFLTKKEWFKGTVSWDRF
jgi:hypothetical protein